MVFHCFSWLSWISGATGKENEKKEKNEKKWKFPRVFEDFLVRSENLQLWVQIFIFFHLQLHLFFHFPLFLMVFHCFSLFFMVFLDFRCHGKGKWKKQKKWKFPRVFEDFLVRSENLQLWVQIFIFFSFATSFFFSFSFVFDGFPLFFIVFHGFPGFQVPRERKMKKTWKKMKKKWKFPLVFEDFLVRSENLQLWVQIFIFFHLQLHFFFIFLCFWWFSIVFHCFSWFSWISGATGKENEKKNEV